jgi:hypothetical protein
MDIDGSTQRRLTDHESRNLWRRPPEPLSGSAHPSNRERDVTEQEQDAEQRGAGLERQNTE